MQPMQTFSRAEILGFVELRVGSIAVQVPLRAADPWVDRAATATSQEEPPSVTPLASFSVEGDTCAILVRGDTDDAEVEEAVREAARVAERHLSRKLLN